MLTRVATKASRDIRKRVDHVSIALSSRDAIQ